MSYTALYRKYRPQVFGDVIGQEHITETLINQITLGKVSHAYLFTGSRGTGKTTSAKIFAKAVNCTSPVKGSPCGKCNVCKALDDPSNIDIQEIDAASNNKVDEIREIRDRVKYLPVNGKYKVYIIDEVHMLTDSAFNALLKTLEEPPQHVIFILATTEAHKLPATILSRCMRFDFRLVGKSVLADKLEKVYKAEKKTAEKEAISYLASLAEGSVRDMLSLADMCINYSDKKLTYADVLSVLGATDKKIIAKLFFAIKDNDTAVILDTINDLANSGKSMSLIAKDVVAFARDLLALQTVGDKLVTLSSETIAEYKQYAEQCASDFLVVVITELSKIDMELRYSISPRIVLEIACIRVGKLTSDDYFALSTRLGNLEKKYSSGELKKVEETTSTNSSEPNPAKEKPSITKSMDAKSVWGRIMTASRKSGQMQLYTLVSGHKDYAIDKDNLVVYTTEASYTQFSSDSTMDAIINLLKADGSNLGLDVIKRKGGVDMDTEIERLKRAVGDIKVNIKKKK